MIISKGDGSYFLKSHTGLGSPQQPQQLLMQGPELLVSIANPSPFSNKVTTCLAVIDTGASASFIDESLVSNLSLTSVNSVKYTGANMQQAEYKNQYAVDLTIPGFVIFPGLPVTAINLQTLRCRCLIGRDILSQAKFEYDGRFAFFRLNFR